MLTNRDFCAHSTFIVLSGFPGTSSENRPLAYRKRYSEAQRGNQRDVSPASAPFPCTASPAGSIFSIPSLTTFPQLSCLSFFQDPEGGSTSGKGHSCVWLSEGKHGVVPVCLEGLGQPRAGSLLPVVRRAESLGDQHEEKKVAVVLRRRGAELQLCMEGEQRGIHTDRLPVFRAAWGNGGGGGGLPRGLSLKYCTRLRLLTTYRGTNNRPEKICNATADLKSPKAESQMKVARTKL